jgi:hypothetical protein
MMGEGPGGHMDMNTGQAKVLLNLIDGKTVEAIIPHCSTCGGALYRDGKPVHEAGCKMEQATALIDRLEEVVQDLQRAGAMAGCPYCGTNNIHAHGPKCDLAQALAAVKEWRVNAG